MMENHKDIAEHSEACNSLKNRLLTSLWEDVSPLLSDVLKLSRHPTEEDAVLELSRSELLFIALLQALRTKNSVMSGRLLVEVSDWDVLPRLSSYFGQKLHVEFNCPYNFFSTAAEFAHSLENSGLFRISKKLIDFLDHLAECMAKELEARNQQGECMVKEPEARNKQGQCITKELEVRNKQGQCITKELEVRNKQGQCITKELEVRNKQGQCMGKELGARNKQWECIAMELEAINKQVQCMGKELGARNKQWESGVAEEATGGVENESTWHAVRKTRTEHSGRGNNSTNSCSNLAGVAEEATGGVGNESSWPATRKTRTRNSERGNNSTDSYFDLEPIYRVESSAELLAAVRNNDLAAAVYAIECGAEIEYRCNRSGSTPLHLSTYCYDTDILELLLDIGADVEAVNNIGNKPLHEAAYHGRKAVVSRLLEAGAIVDSRGNIGSTPLLMAAINGYSRTMRVLLNAGADVNAANIAYDRPLHVAASEGRNKAVALLVKFGADLHAEGSAGQTALAKANNDSTAQLLRRLGAQR